MKKAFPKSRTLPANVQAYRDPKGSYWIPAADGGWVKIRRITNYLIYRCGVPRADVSEYTLRVQEQHTLACAGPRGGGARELRRTEKGWELTP